MSPAVKSLTVINPRIGAYLNLEAMKQRWSTESWVSEKQHRWFSTEIDIVVKGLNFGAKILEKYFEFGNKESTIRLAEASSLKRYKNNFVGKMSTSALF